jgi:CxxC-x17-CxxC domain-containing protein
MYVDENTEEAPQEDKTNEQETVESTEDTSSEENKTEEADEAPAEEPVAEEAPAEEPASAEEETPAEEPAQAEETTTEAPKAEETGEVDERGRKLFSVECADCGNVCKVPFEPNPEKPVYCKDCYQNHRPPRRSGGFGGGGHGGGGGRGGGGGGYDRGPRQTFDATCADCKKECQVPFKPSGDRPVYCRDCYQNHR